MTQENKKRDKEIMAFFISQSNKFAEAVMISFIDFAQKTSDEVIDKFGDVTFDELMNFAIHLSSTLCATILIENWKAASCEEERDSTDLALTIFSVITNLTKTFSDLTSTRTYGQYISETH